MYCIKNSVVPYGRTNDSEIIIYGFRIIHFPIPCTNPKMDFQVFHPYHIFLTLKTGWPLYKYSDKHFYFTLTINNRLFWRCLLPM